MGPFSSIRAPFGGPFYVIEIREGMSHNEYYVKLWSGCVYLRVDRFALQALFPRYRVPCFRAISAVSTEVVEKPVEKACFFILRDFKARAYSVLHRIRSCRSLLKSRLLSRSIGIGV